MANLVDDVANKSRAMSAPQKAPRSPTSVTHAHFGATAPFANAPKVGSHSRWSSSKAYSMGAKLGTAGRMSTPGPGAYSPSHSTLPFAPRYSLGARRELSSHMAYVPGPGAYSPSNPTHQIKNIAVGQKLSYGSPYAAGKGTPGPAAYNVDAATSMTGGMATQGGKRWAPKWSFGLRPSMGGPYAANAGTPGPGAYDTLNPKGLSYSMTPKGHTKQASITPGPGAYELVYGSTRKGIFTSTKNSMHGRLRTQVTSNMRTPGPGQYEAPQQFHSAPLPG